VVSTTATVAVVLLAWTLWAFFSPVVSGNSDVKHTVTIVHGMSFNQILDLLQRQEVVNSRAKFAFVARVSGLRTKLKAGRYAISGGESSYALLKKLSEARVATELVTIPEGKTAREIAGILQERVGVDSTEFMRLVNDSAFCVSLDVPAERLEGFLFPETYRLSWGMSAKHVITGMVEQFHRSFVDSLRRKLAESGFSLLEIVTLASIIEGEAIVDSERKTISAVYHNRLKRGMALQADPTIQYIVPGGPRRLRNRHLQIDSPYNTYLYTGLPPGPINNPGIASIEASLFPAPVNYLYFVATGDGTHTFSKTYREHLRAKAKFDRIRRQLSRSKRKG